MHISKEKHTLKLARAIISTNSTCSLKYFEEEIYSKRLKSVTQDVFLYIHITKISEFIA